MPETPVPQSQRPRAAIAATLAGILLVLAWLALGQSVVRSITRSEMERVQSEVLDAAAHGQPHRLGSFIPPPVNNGPGYYFQGQITAGAGAFGPFDVGKEPVTQCVVVDGGVTSTISTEINIAPGEVCDYDALVDFTPVGVSSATNTGRCKTELLGTMLNGVCTTPDGGSFSHLTYTDFGSGISDAGCSLVTLDAGTLGVQVFTPVTECVGGSISAVRRLPSWQAQDAGTYTDGGTCEVLQVYPSSLSTTVSSNTVIQAWLPLGCAPGVTGMSLGATALTSVGGCVTGALGCIQGTLPAATYSSGAQTVSVTSATQTITSCASNVPCFQFSTFGISSITPNTGNTTIGSPVSETIVTTGGATGTCSASVGATALTGCGAPTGGNTYVCSLPAGSYSAGAVNVTGSCTGSGTFTQLTNGFTFVNAGTPGALSAIYPNRGISGTTVHGTISTCVGCTTGNTQAAFVCAGTAVAATVASISNSGSPSAFTVTAGANAESATANNCNLVLNSGGSLGGGGFTGGNSSTGGTSAYFQEPAGLLLNADAKYGNPTSYSPSTNVSSFTDFQFGGVNTFVQATSASQPTGVTATYNSSAFPALNPTGTTTNPTQFMANSMATQATPITACWVGDAATASQSYINGGASANIRCFLGGASHNQISCNDGTGTALIDPGTITTTTPREFCFVDNGASSAIYRDGTSVVAGSLTTGVAGIGASGMLIGESFGGGSYLNGHIANVEIWAAALTGTQITHHHLEDVADWAVP